MNRILTTFIIITAALAFGTSLGSAQGSGWAYMHAITFPVADSLAAKPYLCTVDKNGRVYVISSKVDDARAHNAIYYANPGDTVFTKFIDFDNNGQSDTATGFIGALRGIAVLNNDVMVIGSQPYPKTKPNTVAVNYYFPDADTTKLEKFGFGIAGAGYGSYLNGMDVSRDTMVITGIDFGTTFRWYNFGYTFKKSARGSWHLPDTNNNTIFSNTTEPGGPQSAGLDLIRDVALTPNADYYDNKSVFYTSRNSISSSQNTGGIAVWSGGTAVQPIGFTGNRVSDFSGYLSFINSFPYGITVDANGILWVAGVDSTKRWVKGFKVDGVNAEPLYDLPSKNSLDVADPNGAPMTGPSDVAITKDMKFAYVADRYARAVFRFRNLAVGVRDANTAATVRDFTLGQNYPNPFNPSTLISFTLAAPAYVKLSVTDMLGREVAVLADGYRSSGKHVEVFNAAGMPSGIYFYSIVTPHATITKKMMLLK